MLNYSLNKEASKTFIQYYKEYKDSLVVHFADRTKFEVVENTEEMKEKLNTIEENQIKDFNTSDFSTPKGIFNISKSLFTLAFYCSGLVALGGGFVALLVSGLPSAITITKLSTIFYIPATLLSGYAATLGLSARKFNLFLKYKKRINKFYEENNTEQEIINTNTNNPVVKPKKVKNLSINDVNFMSYRQVKKLTKTIDKIELEERKYEHLGIKNEKVLSKKYR